MIWKHLLVLNISFACFKNDEFAYSNSFFCVALVLFYIGRLKKRSEDVNLNKLL